MVTNLDVTERTAETPAAAAYRGFMSYSHAADAKLAAALQLALQGFAKPWYRLRMIRIFRDKTSLSANPALWPAIQLALSQSAWFLLMASEESARSKWVEQEVRWWAANRSTDRMLIVLTGGTLEWNPVASDFDWTRTSAVGAYVSGMFRNEPLFVDLRWAKSSNELSVRHSQFRAAVLDLAAPLYDQPKDALDGEDVRQHRRSRRVAWSAGVALALLTIVAVITSILAIQQARIAETRRQDAERARQIAVARQLAAQSESLRGERTDFLPTSLLLGAESLRRTFSLEAVQSVQKGLQLLPLRGSLSFKHTANVNDAVLTPDERTLITASDDGAVRIWDAATGVEKARLDTGARVLDLYMSNDGSLVVSQPLEFDAPGTIHAWDVASAKHLWSFEHAGTAAAVAVRPDGSEVATGGSDGVLRILDSSTGQQRLGLAHDSGITAVAYAPDGRRLVSGSRGGVTRLWDLSDGREIWNFVTNGAVHTVAFSPDGQRVATGGWDFHTRVIAADTGGEVTATSSSGRVITAVQFSPDSRLLAAASDDGSARVFSAADGSDMRRISPQGGVLGVAFSGDSRLLATTGLATAIHVWDVGSTREIARFAMSGMALKVRFGPRNTLLVAGADETARVLTVEDEGALHSGERLPAATFSPDGRLAAVRRTPDTVVITAVEGSGPPRRIKVGDAFDTLALTNDGSLLIAQDTVAGKLSGWNVATGAQLWEIVRPSSTREWLRATEMSADGRFVTFQFADARYVTVVDATTGRELAHAVHDDPLRFVTFSRDGRLLATGADTTAKVWAADSGELIHRIDLQAAPSAGAFSPDGAILATGGADRMARLWDVKSGREIRRMMHSDNVFATVFNRSGSVLATAAPDGVRLWDVASAAETRFLAHDGSVEYMAFSPDDDYLATGSRDHSARVWRVADGQEVARMTDLGEAFRVMFDSTARFLLVQHNDAASQFWRPWLWRPDDLIAEVCGRLGRSLSEVEWQRFLGGEVYRATCETRAAVP